MTPESRFAATLDRLLPETPVGCIGVAVSGGGDSLALLMLTMGWARARGPDVVPQIQAITVDHGLRKDSGAEAAWVAARAAELGADHVTLRWQGWDGQGNLQAEARAARYRLMGDWARAERPDMPVILLGHTRDDLAETFLMRLARGSGVDGLAAMAETSDSDGVRFLRPLLSERRKALRDVLNDKGLTWLDDPSNDDPKFDRIRVRQALDLLGPLGVTADRLADTACHMSRARAGLEAHAADTATRIVTEPLPGVILFDRPAFAATDRETQLRLLAHGLQRLASAAYRPRLKSLETALDDALTGKGSTLHGGHILATGTDILVTREHAAVADLEVPADGHAKWDSRWQVRGTRLQGCTIRALGAAGASKIDRPPGLPHAALISYPGVWSAETLVAAPNLWHGALCQAIYAPQAGFHRTILPH
ncbi:tRNA lysidine(34) synthetase TilS [Rhodophyticola sp. CCM32]|uniref:tRNA lysidine(34) synthetase TilS n=1 Tax=Rhodophyticola sp. CCM32 TaxID=2916397 RepID=UPI00107FC608|nr:tRNA lysidine(34) synthetase TilS [Rhodophyticola sp. CCM32]QBY00104.1 tRNA lysidine(34) synthetase TilS [Rhodophyticola sp. CCM32]